MRKPSWPIAVVIARFTLFATIFMLQTVMLQMAMVQPAQAGSSDSLNKTMVEIGLTMEGLFPLLFDETTFDKQEPDKKAQKKLKKSVKNLSTLFNKAKPHFNSKSPTYRISFEVIETQLSNALSAIKYKNYNYTKSILKDFTSVCTSCHTQDSKLRTLFPSVGRNSFSSDLEYAEFNYMTRNYETAIEFYNKHLAKVSIIQEAELLSIIKRIVTINIQIFDRPADAIKQLSSLENYKHHSKFSKKTLDEWLGNANYRR